MDDAKGCMGAKCGGLKTQDVSVGNSCKVKNRVLEDVDGCKCPSLLCLPSGSNVLQG
jgi:hypothetical protein